LSRVDCLLPASDDVLDLKGPRSGRVLTRHCRNNLGNDGWSEAVP
jgi:hypothetical protein